MKRFLPLLLCIATLAFSISPVLADNKPPATPAKRHTVIGTISSDSITVDTGSNTKTFKIDKHTQFFYLGSKATADELKVGMRVSVTPGFDGKTASSINANDAPVKADPAKK